MTKNSINCKIRRKKKKELPSAPPFDPNIMKHSNKSVIMIGGLKSCKFIVLSIPGFKGDMVKDSSN
jgi:hypothetical protein